MLVTHPSLSLVLIAALLVPGASNAPFDTAQASYWKPPVALSWQWQIDGSPLQIIPGVQLYDLDYEYYSAADVAKVKATGAHAFCYMDIGAWESYRPDAKQFPPEVIGPATGWNGEQYLDIANYQKFASILQARFDVCQAKGFDGIEGDYQNNLNDDPANYFHITYDQQLAFNQWFIGEAHKRGLSAGLKNAPEYAAQWAQYYDWALNEQCWQYQECEGYKTFVAQGKPVLNAEYKGDPTTFCPKANAANFNTIKKRPKLDAWRVACR